MRKIKLENFSGQNYYKSPSINKSNPKRTGIIINNQVKLKTSRKLPQRGEGLTTRPFKDHNLIWNLEKTIPILSYVFSVSHTIVKKDEMFKMCLVSNKVQIIFWSLE